MDISYFRSSSYNSWDFCQQQYYLNYVLGIPQDVNTKAQKGTMFHKVMECLALGKLSLQTGVPEIDDVAGQIDTARLYDDDYVDHLLNVSFEHYRAYKPELYPEKDKKEIKKWIIDTFNFNGGMFDPRNRNIFAAEQSFDFQIEEAWADKLRLRGTVDLITNLSDNIIEVIDWKTGQRKDWATGEEKDLKKLQKDPQLMIYFYALKHLFPTKTIMFTIYFARSGGPFTVYYDDETLTKVSELLEKRYLEIKKSKVPKLIDPSHRDFKCSKLCHYYKNNYEGTSIPICDYIHRKVVNDGISYVTLNMKYKDHSIDNYKAPGGSE